MPTRSNLNPPSTPTRRSCLRALVALVALGLVAAACGDDASEGEGAIEGDDASEEGAATPESETDEEFCIAERRGGDITFSAFSMTTGFDPVISTGSGTTGSIEMAAVYDLLISWNEETREFEPKLAEAIEPNADYSVWTMELREEAVFGNGDPVDAEAVKASIERHRDQDNFSTVFADSLAIREIVVTGDYTLEFHLEQPWGTFPFFLGDVAGHVVNPNVVAPGRDEAYHLDPAGGGAGPYEVVSFAPGEEIVLQAKDDWWGDDVFGPVCIETIRVIDIPTSPATFEALELGEIDIMFERDTQVIADIEAAGYDAFWEVSHGGSILFTFAGDPDRITADPRIRQAVQMAIDLEALDERISGGTGLPGSSIMEPSSPVASDVDGLPYDPDRARALVEEVKAEGWDGRIEMVQSDTNPEAGIAIEGFLEAVGFDVDLQAVPINDSIQRIYVNPDYELGLAGSSLHDASPIVSLNRFWGPTNRTTGFGNDAFFAALDEVRAAPDDEEMKQALTTLQGIWNEQVPSVLLSSARQGMAWNDNVHGMYFSHNAVGFFDKAWVE